jgi:hypothetical protein
VDTVARPGLGNDANPSSQPAFIKTGLPRGITLFMDRSQARATINATVWLFGALLCVAGFAVVMLLLSSRPAAALDLPSVGSVVHDPVGTVTKTVDDAVPVSSDASNPAPTEAAATQPATRPAADAPALLAPVDTAIEPVTDAVERVTTPVAGIVDDAAPAVTHALTPVTDAVDGVVAPTAQRVIAPVAVVVDGVVEDVVAPAAQRVVTPVAGVVDDLTPSSSSGPTAPSFGGTARRLTAPTVAPFPLTTDASSSTSPPALPITATGTEQFGVRMGAERVTRASGARTATAPPAPRDHVPFDMPADTPAAPLAPGGTSSPNDGGSRAPTPLLNFAIVHTTDALALVPSRLVALHQGLPRTQFLTVLIERPG